LRLEVAICLPEEAETVALARTAVTSTLMLFGVTPECVEEIALALSEACTNVIQHAHGREDYEVQLRVDDERCELRVKNAGDGFDAFALIGVMPDPLSEKGRGVAIMRSVMDSADFTSEPEVGTIVHLVKTLSLVAGGPLSRPRRDEP
jgi:serine/threonine-protein kinase RsbW